MWAGHGQAQLIQPRGVDLPGRASTWLSDLTWYPRLSAQRPQKHKNKTNKHKNSRGLDSTIIARTSYRQLLLRLHQGKQKEARPLASPGAGA